MGLRSHLQCACACERDRHIERVGRGSTRDCTHVLAASPSPSEVERRNLVSTLSIFDSHRDHHPIVCTTSMSYCLRVTVCCSGRRWLATVNRIEAT